MFKIFIGEKINIIKFNELNQSVCKLVLKIYISIKNK